MIGDISSPHGAMLAAAQHTLSAYGGGQSGGHGIKRGHDDLLSVPHHGGAGRLGVSVAIGDSGMGSMGGLGMGVGVGGYDGVEMLLPLFTPTNASFERLLADTEVKQDSKRIRID